MMKILLSDITEDGLDTEFNEAIETDVIRMLSPLKAKLRIGKVSSEILVNGSLSALVEMQCSRCLNNFTNKTDININVVYHPVEELKGVDRHEIKDDELDTGFYRDEQLDISELLKEQLILSLPMKPLCSESCRGICFRCGKNLNIDSCECRQEEPDPRLAKLKKLLDDRKE